MIEPVGGPRPGSERSREPSIRPEPGPEALVDGLCQALADAAGRGLLLASGPLSRRKTDWLLSQLAEELRQAGRLVEAMKQTNTQTNTQGR